jgi:group I intron endonuclease
VDIDKFAILKDNKDKIGIYRWVNLDTGKSYVGSSRNLSARFKQYFSVNYLEREIKRNNSKIYRSLFKKGYSKFSLDCRILWNRYTYRKRAILSWHT